MNRPGTTAMLNIRRLPELRSALLGWYVQRRRKLPWRETRDPYRIWLSEIMLQQTRVAVVLERYEQFLRRFPSVHVLAAARVASVLAEWSGLGYYRRARNLHAAAKIVSRQHGGELPESAAALRDLPGVGRYTAAAIASIAFGQPVSVVDGNVERVLERLLGRDLNGGATWDAAEELLDQNHPGDFNQAMMELGATVCLPTQPRCAECPLRRFCRTRGPGESRRRKKRQVKREVTYALSRRERSVLLVRRPADHRLMPGMWELPEISAPAEGSQTLFSLRHSITVSNFAVRVVCPISPPTAGSWVPVTRLSSLPLTGLAKKILQRAEVIQLDSGQRGRS